MISLKLALSPITVISEQRLDEYQFYIGTIRFGRDINGIELLNVDQSSLAWWYRDCDGGFDICASGDIEVDELDTVKEALLRRMISRDGSVFAYVQLEFKVDGDSPALKAGKDYEVKGQSLVSVSLV